MRTRRRNRSLKKGGYASEIEKELLGLHLHADVVHDFGEVNPPYYIKHPRDLADIRNEDKVVDFFKTDNTKVTNVVLLRDERIQESTKFTMHVTTDTFNDWKRSCLWSAGNDIVGIVHDAGKFVTPIFEAHHVITFGNIVDPAGTPNKKEDNPLYFKSNKEGNNLYLYLDSFGFDPNVIQSVKIKDLTKDSASCIFYTPSGKYDAVTGEKLQDESNTKGKDINKSQGFLASIADANKQDNILYKVGKTLGDTLLVISAMPKLPNNDRGGVFDNPYLTNGKWVDFDGNAVETQPQVLVLKTNDRLNHLRAFIKGVPSILQHTNPIPNMSQMGGAEKRGRDSNSESPEAKRPKAEKDDPFYVVSKCEFIPAPIEEGAILKKLNESMALIIPRIKQSYDDLVQSIKVCVDTNGSLKPQYSRFSEGSPPTIQAPERLALAGKMFTTRLIPGIIRVKENILPIFDKILGEFDKATDISTKNTLLGKANGLFDMLTPKRRSITKGNVLHPDIIIISVPSGRSIEFGLNKTFHGSILIQLEDVFIHYYCKIKPEDSENLSIIRSDLHKYFFTIVDNIPVKEETRSEKIKKFFDRIKYSFPTSKKFVPSDIEYIIDEDETELTDVASTALYPFKLFYMNLMGRSVQTSFNFAVDIYNNYSNGFPFIDNTLAKSIADGVKTVIDSKSIKGGSIGSSNNTTKRKDNRTIEALLVFNAFVCYVNKQNAKVFGYVNEANPDEIVVEDNDISEDYDIQQQIYTDMFNNMKIPANPILPVNVPVKLPAGITAGAKRRRTFRRKHSRRNKQ
jgi:hypothetical protein